VNSYEQLMINYANEKLQSKFTADVFKAMQMEYEAEEIAWGHVPYSDNAQQVNAIEGPILSGMNEELRTTGLDHSFVFKLRQALTSSSSSSSAPSSSSSSTSFNPSSASSSSSSSSTAASAAAASARKVVSFPRGTTGADAVTFTVHHYAGSVTYDAGHGGGFLAKHKDALFPDLKRLLSTTSDPFLKHLFNDDATAAALASSGSGSGSGGNEDHGGGSGGRVRSSSISSSSSSSSSSSNRRGSLSSALGAASVGSQFKASLNELLKLLNSSEAHYVRCVKPNAHKLAAGTGDGSGTGGGGNANLWGGGGSGGGGGGKGDSFDMKMVAEQLRCAGVVEAVKVARSCYPNRVG
jgi:myosin-5